MYRPAARLGQWSSRRAFLRAAGALPVAAPAALLLAGRRSNAAEPLPHSLTVEDPEGCLGRTAAPVSARFRLTSSEREAARQGRLVLRERTSGAASPNSAVPVQLVGSSPPDEPVVLGWLMPPGQAGPRRFTPTVGGPDQPPPLPALTAGRQGDTGQYEVRDGPTPVLRYNYASVEPEPAFLAAVTEGNRIYARARGDYLHPLFGLDGEELTRDWSVDHPHHRGIYWAWPETDWRGRRGDLHALQKVFARPTGRCTTRSGPVFAQIEAENDWLWEDRDPVVRELAILRAYRATGPASAPTARVIDLEFRFTALADSVHLARRATNLYGGLNIRLAAVRDQRLDLPPEAGADELRRSWAGLSGTFPGAAGPSGIVILQHPANPDHPGDWVRYPELNWLQPTFPAANTRHELKPGAALILRYRLVIHRGTPPDTNAGNDLARAFRHDAAPDSPLPG
jgi:hypothetical protein